ELRLRARFKLVGCVLRQTPRRALRGEPTKRLIDAGVKTQVGRFFAPAAQIKPLLVEKFARTFEIRAELSLGEERFSHRRTRRGRRKNLEIGRASCRERV